MKILEYKLADLRRIRVAYESEVSLNAFLSGLLSKTTILETKEVDELTFETIVLD